MFISYALLQKFDDELLYFNNIVKFISLTEYNKKIEIIHSNNRARIRVKLKGFEV